MDKDLCSEEAVRNQYGSQAMMQKNKVVDSSTPVPTTSKKVGKTEQKSKTVVKPAEPKPVKRKIEEPESKIGKWQKVDEKKLNFIDLKTSFEGFCFKRLICNLHERSFSKLILRSKTINEYIFT